MATTTKKKDKIATMTATVHGRVTHRTPPPYLAQVMNMRGEPTQVVIYVREIVRNAGWPPYGIATVVTSRPGAVFYKEQEKITVDNFRCLRRLEVTAIEP